MIRGAAEARTDLLTAPLSGRPCIAFTLSVAFWHEYDEPQAPWSTVELDRQGAPFAVVDETGSANVEFRADLGVLLGTPSEYEHADDVVTRRFARQEPKARVGRFRDVAIFPGEVVSVCGRASWRTDPAGAFEGYREVQRKLRLDSPGSGDPILVITTA
jgi:hypothetical protein